MWLMVDPSLSWRDGNIFVSVTPKGNKESALMDSLPCDARPLRNTIYVETDRPYTLPNGRQCSAMILELQDRDHEMIDHLLPAREERIECFWEAISPSVKDLNGHFRDDGISLRFQSSWPHLLKDRNAKEWWWDRQDNPVQRFFSNVHDGDSTEFVCNDYTSSEVKVSITDDASRRIREERRLANEKGRESCTGEGASTRENVGRRRRNQEDSRVSVAERSGYIESHQGAGMTHQEINESRQSAPCFSSTQEGDSSIRKRKRSLEQEGVPGSDWNRPIHQGLDIVQQQGEKTGHYPLWFAPAQEHASSVSGGKRPIAQGGCFSIAEGSRSTHQGPNITHQEGRGTRPSAVTFDLTLHWAGKSPDDVDTVPVTKIGDVFEAVHMRSKERTRCIVSPVAGTRRHIWKDEEYVERVDLTDYRRTPSRAELVSL